MTQRTTPSELARIFDAEIRDPESLDELGPRYNVAPTQPLTVVVQRDDGRMIELHRWGLMPAWSMPAAATSGRLINARAETVAVSSAFRVAFRNRRCIVPADGFYEWLRDGRTRHPYLIQRRGGGPMAFAGLWAPWRDPASGGWVLSAAVITTKANAAVGQLHDRMPVILDPADWSTWIDPGVSDSGLLEHLLRPAADDALELFPVSPRVNSPHNEGAELIERAPDPPLAATLFSTGPG